MGRRLERLGADFGKRLASGVILAIVAGLCLWLGGWATALLAMAAAGVMGWEWRSIAHGRPEGDSIRSLPLIGALVGAALLTHLGAPFGAMALLAAGGAASALIERRRGLAGAWSLIGAACLGLSICAFLWLRGRAADGLITAAWLVLAVAATDIGAYLAGRLIGGPKLAPRISPKKTWAGLGGGVTLAAIVGAAFSGLTTGTWAVQVALISAVTAVVAQMGDLSESAYKRRFNVKDASNIIPGHGGVMDRVDGLMAAALMAALIVGLRGEGMFSW